MSSAKLSLTQIAVLSALMVEARELSNAELTDLAGVPLTGEDRIRLVSGGLVEERKVGRSYAFQLSPRGWSTGLSVLAEQAQGKGAAATTVRMLLHGLNRALETRGVDARSFFAPEAAAPVEVTGITAAAAPDADAGGEREERAPASPAAASNVAQSRTVDAHSPALASVDELEDRIRTAYAKLATEPAGWVSLADLRELLEDIPRAEVDTALKWMAVQPGVRLIPVANLKSLSTRDREAALRFGGEENHAFAIEA